jgi:predicted DNA-binding protein
MVREQLSKGLNLRISPTEMEMLDALSEATGLPKGGVVRQLIRREHQQVIGVVPVTSKRKTKR